MTMVGARFFTRAKRVWPEIGNDEEMCAVLCMLLGRLLIRCGRGDECEGEEVRCVWLVR